MFSIIIPTLNNYEYLKICIESIKKNSRYNHQILVHVNIGSDETKNFLKKNNIEFSESSHNSGLCLSVNTAAKMAKKDYILYSHDDFYFCPNWDDYILREIKEIGHERFYFSSTQINTYGFEDFNCGDSFLNFDEKKLLGNLSKKSFPDLQGSTWAPHIVHKKVWEKAGGFSEEFFPGAGSDPDFNLKLWKLGIRIFKMIGKSKVYHFESKTLRDPNKFKYFNAKDLGSKSSKIFLKKWGISTKFFRKHYLKANTLFISELKEPKMNISYLYDLIICKIKYLYIIFFSKKIATDERKFEKI